MLDQKLTDELAINLQYLVIPFLHLRFETMNIGTHVAIAHQVIREKPIDKRVRHREGTEVYQKQVVSDARYQTWLTFPYKRIFRVLCCVLLHCVTMCLDIPNFYFLGVLYLHVE